MSKALSGAGHSLVAVQDNLIDAVWMDRPERPSTQLRALGLDYTGKSKAGLALLLLKVHVFGVFFLLFLEIRPELYKSKQNVDLILDDI